MLKYIIHASTHIWFTEIWKASIQTMACSKGGFREGRTGRTPPTKIIWNTILSQFCTGGLRYTYNIVIKIRISMTIVDSTQINFSHMFISELRVIKLISVNMNLKMLWCRTNQWHRLKIKLLVSFPFLFQLTSLVLVAFSFLVQLTSLVFSTENKFSCNHWSISCPHG